MPSLLPTATARDYKDEVSKEVALRQVEKRKSPIPGLLGSAGLLPSLTAQDANGRDRHNQRDGSVKLSALGMAKADLLPTLTAVSYGRNKSASDGASIRLSPEAMAKNGLLPTLTAMDSADKPMPPRNKTTKESGKVMGGQKPPILSVIGGALNPEWCEVYLGFPVGWTSSVVAKTPAQTRKQRVRQMGNAIYPEIAEIFGHTVMADFGFPNE